MEMAAVPIGTPLIAGPGLLAASLIVMQEHGFAFTALAVFFNILLCAVIFFAFERIISRVGLAGARAMSKIISLLLAAFAVMMIRKGLEGIL